MDQELIDALPLDAKFAKANRPSEKLMIVLHGRGDSYEGYEWLPGFLELEDMNYVMFNAPFEYFGGYSWYDLPPNQLPGIAYSSGLLAQSLDMLFEHSEFKPSSTYLFGFSQGALLSFEFGARYEQILKGYIALSGYIYDPKLLIKEVDSDKLKQLRYFATHGIYDDVLPFEESKKQIEYLKLQGMDVTFYELEKEHNISEEEMDLMLEWMGEPKRSGDVIPEF